MTRPPVLDRLLQRRMAAVAHRGNSSVCPENTIPAFESAIELGVASIEFDARATRDGVLVCIHDEALDRTTDAGALGATGAMVDRMDFAELAPFDAGGWKGERFTGTPVPSLATALGVMHPRTVPMIEHKAGAPELYVQLLHELDLVEDVLLQSFDWEWLRGVRALDPRIPLGALGGEDDRPRLTDAVVAEIRNLGACFVHWRVDRVGRQGVLACGELPVCVYTTDDESEFERLVDAGVAMITTNEPARLMRFLVGGG